MRHPFVFCCAAFLLAASSATARPAAVTFAPAPDPSSVVLVEFTTGRPCDATATPADLPGSGISSSIQAAPIAWLPSSAIAVDRPSTLFVVQEGQETPRRRPKAVEYSEAYEVRRKIHWYASFATAPLFAVEFALGQSLYNNPGTGEGGKRGAHSAMAASIAGLFAANTVTGVWNLWEGRKDPTHRTRRFVHGILMIAADAGFMATGLLAPSHEGAEHGEFVTPIDPATLANQRSRHRTVALTSMATAAASYVMMLIWR